MLYDITDEYAAHERQNFFREDKFTQKEIIFQMPVTCPVCGADVIREEATFIVKKLSAMNTDVVLLTGDNKKTAWSNSRDERW